MSKSDSKNPLSAYVDYSALGIRINHPRSHREQAKSMRYLLALSTEQLHAKSLKLRALEQITRDAVGELRSIGYLSVARSIEARLDASLDR